MSRPPSRSRSPSRLLVASFTAVSVGGLGLLGAAAEPPSAQASGAVVAQKTNSQDHLANVYNAEEAKPTKTKKPKPAKTTATTTVTATVTVTETVTVTVPSTFGASDPN
jgi:hypothetical protein